MRPATLETWSAAYDALKARYPRLEGNIFLDASRLAALFRAKRCLLEETESALFLLTPRHSFHDVLFLTGDASWLPPALETWLPAWPAADPLRVSVIGCDPRAEELAAQFAAAGFGLVKKLLRTRVRLPEGKMLAAMRPFAEEARDLLGYARHGDEEEILEILRESFDLMGDNLPELTEISEHIDNGGIAVARKDGRILALNYFSIQSGVLHSFYDVTRKEYRGGGGLFMALTVFIHDDLEARGIPYTRGLGWRDAAQKRLLRHALKNDQQPDGIVIYNMRRPAPDPDPA
ncbi:MAG: hypothetical protein K2J64_09530 [Desulfovibrio sp.]|nr:hypothetical protein [Desulfovibrio sp.]